MFGIKTEGEEFFELVFTVIENLPETQVPTFVFGVCWLACWSDWRAGCRAYRARWRSARWRLPRPSPSTSAATGWRWSAQCPRGAAADDSVVHWADIAALAPAAVAIAFLAFSDGILLAQTFAEKNGYEVRPNRELVALGSANILAGFWQGFPVSASQSRTSIVDSAGGKTQVAQLMVALGLLLFLFFLTG
jgi:MFS superfamily sulfate permease-like transporter